MKISEILFEGPYHHDGDWAPAMKLAAFPSFDGLKRENLLLGTLDRSGKEYHFWLSASKLVARVSTEDLDDIGQLRQQVVTEIRFHKSSAGLPVQNELQVHTVFSDPDHRQAQLAMALYVVLCRYGYTIVSDFEQFNGGKALWKKMAAEADARKFVIRVWSDADSDWIRDVAGEPISYDAYNLSDETIWQDFSKHMEPTTLLVLSSN